MTISRTRNLVTNVIGPSTPVYYNYDGEPVNESYRFTSFTTKEKTIWDYLEKDNEVPQIEGYLNPSGLQITDWTFRPTVVTFHKYFIGGRPLAIGEAYGGLGSRNPYQLNTYVSGHEPTSAELTADLLTRTTPSRSEVSLPVMVGELLETVTLFKFVTNNMASLIGSSYLKFNFGIRPFLSDVHALADIVESINSRIKEYNSLVGEGGLSRSVHLFSKSWEVTEPERPLYTAAATYIYGVTRNSYKTKIWGSVRWFPKEAETIPSDPLEQFVTAARAVTDTDALSWDTIWEIVPFTWLIDYFVSVGPTLQVQDALKKFEPKHICLMRERSVSTTQEAFRVTPGGATVNGSGEAKLVNRTREVINPNFYSDFAFLPVWTSFITEGESTNIVALLSTKAKYEDLVTVARRIARQVYR